jgi:GR25 family glycosyltransferase involved in LPS biosynthesis
MVRSNIPLCIICEDDADFTGERRQVDYLHVLLSEGMGVGFDCMFLSWYRPVSSSLATSAHTRRQWCFNQLWVYAITLEGARKCVEGVREMRYPVDVALWEAHSRGVLRNLVAYPPLCLTRGEPSDTARR